MIIWIRRCARMLWHVGLFALDTLIRVLPRHQASEATRIRVLVLRLDEIGDFILWLDFARHLRKCFPRDRFHLTLLGNRIWQDLAVMQGIVDRVLPLDRRRFMRDPLYRMRMLHRLAGGGYALIVQNRHSREFWTDDAVVRACRSAKAISPKGNANNMAVWQKRWSDRWYHLVVSLSGEACTELERNSAWISVLSGKPVALSRPRLTLFTPVHEPKRQRYDHYYILMPGAGKSFRRWPAARFGQLADRLYKEIGWTGIICGSEAERPLGVQVSTHAGQARLVDMTGSTTLVELAQLIADADFVIGNESGAIHMAAAVDTPSLCIMGGGHYGRFLPYPQALRADIAAPTVVAVDCPCLGCNWQSTQCFPRRSDPVPCIAAVSVAMVWGVLAQQLEIWGGDKLQPAKP